MNHITRNTRGEWGVEVIQLLAARQPGRGRSRDRSRRNPQARLPETGGTSGEGGG